MGISHIPEDRQSMAVVPGLSVSENLILMNYKDKEHSNHGILRWNNIHAVNTSLCERYNIKTPNVHELLQNLSGGNQQKVVVARELDRSPAIIIAMHPSRGLDVGATRYIQEQILQARENGTAVLLVSTELEEILELSDNIIVMYKGTVMEIVDRKNTTPEYLGLLMAGIHPSS
jgi:simple sugar transport system ATP-binding protein